MNKTKNEAFLFIALKHRGLMFQIGFSCRLVLVFRLYFWHPWFKWIVKAQYGSKTRKDRSISLFFFAKLWNLGVFSSPFLLVVARRSRPTAWCCVSPAVCSETVVHKSVSLCDITAQIFKTTIKDITAILFTWSKSKIKLDRFLEPFSTVNKWHFSQN